MSTGEGECDQGGVLFLCDDDKGGYFVRQHQDSKERESAIRQSLPREARSFRAVSPEGPQQGGTVQQIIGPPPEAVVRHDDDGKTRTRTHTHTHKHARCIIQLPGNLAPWTFLATLPIAFRRSRSIKKDRKGGARSTVRHVAYFSGRKEEGTRGPGPGTTTLNTVRPTYRRRDNPHIHNPQRQRFASMASSSSMRR